MATKDYKGKILFLHGYTQSASIFYAKTSALRKRLIKLKYKPVFLNGPLALTPAQLPSAAELSLFNTVVDEEEATQYRAWWVKPGHGNNGVNLQPAFDSISDYIATGATIADPDLKNQEETDAERNLPIVGVVGFSQGASFASLLAHKFELLFKVPSPRFFVLYSGFKLDTSKGSGNELYDSYYPDPNVPSTKLKYLHVYGELDTVVGEDRSLTFYNITKGNSDLLKHPGGHFVPNSRLLIDQVCNWIQVTEKELEEKSEESKADDNDDKKEESKTDAKGDKKDQDDLASLMDMMDNTFDIKR